MNTANTDILKEECQTTANYRECEEIRKPKGTIVYDGGYEISIDIIPDIGEEAMNSVVQRIRRRVRSGKAVSLADIQRMLGVSGSKCCEKYRLVPGKGMDREMDIDWMMLYRKDPIEGKIVYGRRIFVCGFSSEKRRRSGPKYTS